MIATLCLCVLLTILYYSLVIAWEVFWASRRSPSPLDSPAEVVLTGAFHRRFDMKVDFVVELGSEGVECHWGRGDLETGDYMLGTFSAHVHLSHNVTSG